MAALYANVPMDLPGFARPKTPVPTATMKFQNYIHKYRPSGWTSYDFVDISTELTTLLTIADSDDEFPDGLEHDSMYCNGKTFIAQKKYDSVRRRLNFD